MQQGLSQEAADQQPQWSFNQAAMLTSFKDAGEHLGLSWLTETLYVLRHGGVSRDISLKTRSLQEVQRRGNWAHPGSLKHYEKHGRLQWIMKKMGKNNLSLGDSWLRRCKDVYLGS